MTYFPDESEWLDSDGDGTGDNSDWAPFDSSETTDSDNDGVGDNMMLSLMIHRKQRTQTVMELETILMTSTITQIYNT